VEARGDDLDHALQAARALAAHGATVVLACRDPGRPPAIGDVVRLDLASLDSIRSAAAEVVRRYDRLDLLINNAGVMIPPYGLTADGFELQFGVNHLGHFALTGHLLDLVLRTPGSRVVTVSSNAHRRGVIDFDDLQSTRRYHPMSAYAQSKLANLLFTHELQRRLAGSGTIAVAARTPHGCDLPTARRYALGRAVTGAFGWANHRGAVPSANRRPAVRLGLFTCD
jgi:NAD(P)-dependent dehydrogenase (short-subunit alcohol dehydrogenase family)